MTALALVGTTTGTIADTYRRIDSTEVHRQIDGILYTLGIDYSAKLQHNVGTKSTKHCTIYTLHGLADMKLIGDRITPQIYVYNSYRKESAFMISVGFLRWVCDNGMVAGTDLFSSRIIHRTGQTAEMKVAAIGKGLTDALSYIQSGAFSDDIAELATMPVTDEQAISIIGSLPIPLRAREDAMAVVLRPDLLREEDQGSNVWTLWNIVNECMRLRTNSAVNNLIKNQTLLTDIVDLYEHEVATTIGMEVA